MHAYEYLGRIDLFWFVQLIPDTIFRRERKCCRLRFKRACKTFI